MIRSSLAHRNIPPHHADARSAGEAYRSDEIVPLSFRDALEVTKLFPAENKPDYRAQLKASGMVSAGLALGVGQLGLPGLAAAAGVWMAGVVAGGPVAGLAGGRSGLPAAQPGLLLCSLSLAERTCARSCTCTHTLSPWLLAGRSLNYCHKAAAVSHPGPPSAPRFPALPSCRSLAPATSSPAWACCPRRTASCVRSGAAC